MAACPLDNTNRSRSSSSGIRGIHAKLFEVERHQQIHHRQRTADVPGLGAGHRLDHLPAGLLSKGREVRLSGWRVLDSIVGSQICHLISKGV